MTSKDSNRAPSGAARREYSERTEQHALIKQGLLPGLDELLEGAPWYGDNIAKDIQTWCDQRLLCASLPPARGVKPPPADLTRAIAVLHTTCSLESVKIVHRGLKSARDEDQWRMQCYAACMGDRVAAVALARKIGDESDSWRRGSFDDVWRECTMTGLMTRDKTSMHDYCGLGIVSIESDATMLTEYRNAGNAIAAEAAAKAEAKREADESGKTTAAAAASDDEFLREF